MLYRLESRKGGLLVAAAEARRRAQALRATVERLETQGKCIAAAATARRALTLERLAAWCELEADTYVGASIALTGGQ